MVHNDKVLNVAFSPNGRYLATVSMDGTARIWDATTGELIIVALHENAVNALAFSPNGKYFATGTLSGDAHIWDTTTGEQLGSITHNGGVLGVSFSPDGIYWAAGWWNGVRIWKVDSGQEIARVTQGLHVIFPEKLWYMRPFPV